MFVSFYNSSMLQAIVDCIRRIFVCFTCCQPSPREPILQEDYAELQISPYPIRSID